MLLNSLRWAATLGLCTGVLTGVVGVVVPIPGLGSTSSSLTPKTPVLSVLDLAPAAHAADTMQQTPGAAPNSPGMGSPAAPSSTGTMNRRDNTPLTQPGQVSPPSTQGQPLNQDRLNNAPMERPQSRPGMQQRQNAQPSSARPGSSIGGQSRQPTQRRQPVQQPGTGQ